MAETARHPAPPAAPGTPFINLSTAMQAFYARRGMWLDGKPAGLLATWLGDPCPWKVAYDGVAYWTTHAGLHAIRDDAIAAPLQGWTSYHQCAQFLRRLREAEAKAGGKPPYATPLSSTRRVASTTPGAPFEPLSIPAGDKARKAFELHVMTTVREFIDFTQSSAYMGEDHG